MRFILFTHTILIVATFLASAAQSFEIEAEILFKGQGTESLRIISTTDIDLFQPLITAYHQRNPQLNIQYVQASSAAVFRAITDLENHFDLAISSAMDLQTKAANDGYAQDFYSAIARQFPAWSQWRNQVFGFSQEPAVLVASKGAFDGLPMPQSRHELIEILRNNPQRFRGKIGTYDVRISGLGYLFATQDARQSDTYWRLTEVMGGLDPKLFCCSSSMISAVEAGEVLFSYNVLGSYARRKIQVDDRSVIIPLSDYTNIMMRTVLIPVQAKNPFSAGQFIDFLLSPGGMKILERDVGLLSLKPTATQTENSLRPIRLGPGLLVYLDQLKRKHFIAEWSSSLLQIQVLD